MLILSPTGV